MDTTDRFPPLRGIGMTTGLLSTLQNAMNFQNFHQIWQIFFPWHSIFPGGIHDITITDHLHPVWHFWAHLLAPPTNPSPAPLQEPKNNNNNNNELFLRYSFWLEVLIVSLRVSSKGPGIAKSQTGTLGFHLSSSLESLCLRSICYGQIASTLGTLLYFSTQGWLPGQSAVPSPLTDTLEHKWKEYMCFILAVGTDER